RALHEPAARGAHLRGERLGDFRPHGTHLDEELALHRRQHLRVHRIDGRRIGEYGDDHLACSRELGRRVCNFQSGGARLVGVAVPDHDVVAEAREPRGDAGAHLADSCDADLHVLNTSLVSIATDTLSLEGAWYEPAGAKARVAALLF